MGLHRAGESLETAGLCGPLPLDKSEEKITLERFRRSFWGGGGGPPRDYNIGPQVVPYYIHTHVCSRLALDHAYRVVCQS